MKRLAFIALVCLGCSCSTVNTVSHGIPNLAQVEPGIWRGGQPTAEGWKWLASQGVVLDIKLNPDDEGSDAAAVQCGMMVMPAPITTTEQTVGKPSRDKNHTCGHGDWAGRFHPRATTTPAIHARVSASVWTLAR